jgi:hypothetical protein
MAYFTDVEKAKCVFNFQQIHLATLFNGGFVRIMAKKNLRESQFTNGTNNLPKLVGFVLRRRIRTDDQVTTPWSVFVCRFSVVRTNPQGVQTGN